MGFNYFISTGTILKEYMDSRNISQKELARLTESSEKHVSNLINGKVKLTEQFSIKLEKVFSDVKAEFWMELESKYRLMLLRKKENEFPSLDVVAKEFQFDSVFKGLKYDMPKQAEEMLRLLEVKSFEEAESQIKTMSFNFMEDRGNKRAIFVWLKLCQEALDLQNNIENISTFDGKKLQANIQIYKDLMYTTNFELALKNIRRFSNSLGIALVVHEALPTSKVRGATTFFGNMPAIFLSTRFKRLDTFYFSFIHELFHIINDDFKKTKLNLSFEDDCEIAPNQFARDFFINKDKYKTFIDRINKTDSISAEDIIGFSKENKIIPDIIIGFLEHDKIVTDFSKFNYLKANI